MKYIGKYKYMLQSCLIAVFLLFSICPIHSREKTDMPLHTHNDICPLDGYWDSFDFSDTSLVHNPRIIEPKFYYYIQRFSKSDSLCIKQSIQETLRRAENEGTASTYNSFLGLFKKYLYNADSPFRNDEYYIHTASYIISDKSSAETDKERAKYKLDLLLKNRIGHRASDFMFTRQSGKTASLYETKSDYTILFFYNPDCQACAEAIHSLKNSQYIHMAQSEGWLTILSVYPDADLAIWRKHMADIPGEWINAYDAGQTIEKNRLYDLKAIPTIYLLGKNKEVILKDTDFAPLEQWIYRNIISAK